MQKKTKKLPKKQEKSKISTEASPNPKIKRKDFFFDYVQKKHPIGRPRKYETPEKMQKAILGYIKFCETEGYPLSITGLAMALGFTSRQDLINYEGYSKEFHDTIKGAKMLIENQYERSLFWNQNPGGAIFALKNFNWKDKHEIENSGTLNIKPILGGQTDDIHTDDSDQKTIGTEETN